MQGVPNNCDDVAWTAAGHPGLVVTVASTSLLRLAGDLDLATRDLLDGVLRQMSACDVHLDVAELAFADAAGLAVVAQADADRRRGHTGQIVLHRARPMLQRTVTLAGLERLLPRQEPPDDEPDWRTSAACAEFSVEMFFNEVGYLAAREVCAACQVSGNCLSYALRTRQAFGVWGGLTTPERSELLERQALQPVGRRQ